MSNDQKPKDATQASEMFSIDFDNGFDGVPGVTMLLNPKALKEKQDQIKKEAAAKAAAPAPPARGNMAPPPKAEVKAEPKEISIDLGVDDVITPAPQNAAPIKTLEATRAVEIKFDTAPAQAAPAQTSAPASVASVSSGTANSLAEMGVQFELHFETERGVYRYTRMRAHARQSFALWQEKFYFQMKVDLKVLGVEGSFQEFVKGTHAFQEDAFGLTDASHVQIVRLEGNTQKVFVLISEQSLKSQEQKVRDLLAGKGVSGAGDQSGDDDEGSFKIELAS